MATDDIELRPPGSRRATRNGPGTGTITGTGNDPTPGIARRSTNRDRLLSKAVKDSSKGVGSFFRNMFGSCFVAVKRYIKPNRPDVKQDKGKQRASRSVSPLDEAQIAAVAALKKNSVTSNPVISAPVDGSEMTTAASGSATTVPDSSNPTQQRHSISHDMIESIPEHTNSQPVTQVIEEPISQALAEPIHPDHEETQPVPEPSESAPDPAEPAPGQSIMDKNFESDMALREALHVGYTSPASATTRQSNGRVARGLRNA